MADAQVSSLTTIRLALSLVWRAGPFLVVFIVCTTFFTSLAIAGQLLLGRELLDLVTGDGSVTAGVLAPYLLALGALLLVSALSQSIATELRVPLSERVHRSVTEKILDVATEVDVEAYEGPEFHDRLGRAQSGAGSHSSAVVFGIVTMITTVVVTLGVSAVLIAVAPMLIPLVIIGYLPIVLINLRNNRAMYRMQFDLVENQRERGYLEFLLTQRTEAKEIRSYGLSDTLREWHGALWDERMRRLYRLVRQRLVLAVIGTTFNTAVMVLTLALALVLAVRGTISIGDAAVAIVGLQQLSGRLRAAGSALSGVHSGVTFLRDFESFRAMLPELIESRPTAVPPEYPSELRAEQLAYRYPGSETDALSGVSFELHRGQIMAVVGANGSGKSTLMKLLCRLLPPTAGNIRWDGVDIAECDPELVRDHIAPVFQDYARFLFTLNQAIGLGDVRRLDDVDAVRAAAAQAGLEYLMETLPGGPDARLGKVFTGGTDLSIGQWQRLAIARAFFRDAPIVILDEPSASLDPRGEEELFDLLHDLCSDRIVVFVTHRFATVRSADLVLVLDQGAVVEMGSHDQLMSERGVYRELFDVQAKRYGFMP